MKKLTTFAVALPLLAVGMLLLPAFASAQSMTSVQLQSEISTLLAQVAVLQQQLAAQGGSSSAPAWCHTFNSNLSIGMSGVEVSSLQTALQKDGESVSVSGSFDDQTAAAVTAFQEKYASAILAPNGLSNGTGYAGMSTRAELNSIDGCGSAPVQSPTAPVQSPVFSSLTPTPSVQPAINTSTVFTQINITAPNGGEEFTQGSDYNTITWSGGMGKVFVALVPASYTLAAPTNILGYVSIDSALSGSASWNALNITDLTGTVVSPVQPGSYKILLISQGSYGNYCSESNVGGCNVSVSAAPFTIVATQPSTYLSPTVGFDLPCASWATGSCTANVSGTVTIAGWALDNGTTSAATPISSVTVSVDGGTPIPATYGVARGDVCNAHPGRPGCPYVGYTVNWNSTSVSNGQHTIQVKATDSAPASAGGPNSTTDSITVNVNNTTQSQPTLTVSTDPTNPPAAQLAMGSSGDPVLAMRLTAGNSEDVKLESMTVNDFISNDPNNRASFAVLDVFNGTTLVGSITPVLSGNQAAYNINFFSTPVIIPKGNSVTLVAKGSIPFVSSGSVTAGSQHKFILSAAANGVVAYGATSNLPASVGGVATGNTFTIVNSNIPTPTASLTVTPSSVSTGQTITYNWHSTNAVSWEWTLNIFKSTDLSHTVASDACGNTTGNWAGPAGGLSASGSWTGTIAPCQAGYTYNIMYSAYTGPNHTVQAASSRVYVTVASAPTGPTVTLSPATIPFTITTNQSAGTLPTSHVLFGVSPNQTVNWIAKASANWIAVSPSDSAQNTGSTSIGLNPTASSLVPGIYNGSIVFSPASGSNFTPQTVTVTLKVNAATSGAVITQVQGYNPANQAYTNNTALQGTYLVLYGTFGSSGNTVLIDGVSVPSANVTYQSATQINVWLSRTAPGSHMVSVQTASLGTTSQVPFTVTEAMM